MRMSTTRMTVFFTTLTAGLLLFLLTPLQAREIILRHMTSIYADALGAPLKLPEGVVCNSQSFVIVADTGNARVLKYHYGDGNPENESFEIRMPQIQYPMKTMVDSKDQIYILDGKQHRIIRVSDQGVFEGFFEPKDVPFPSAYTPRSFTIDMDDNVYILDILSERVMVLSFEGAFQRQIEFPEDYGFFSDIAVDRKGSILILDGVKKTIYSIDKGSERFVPLTGNLREYVRFPSHLTLDERGRIYLTDRNGGSVLILGPDGSFFSRQSGMGWKEGFMRYPSQICINDKNEVFVADTINNRVQIFSVYEK